MTYQITHKININKLVSFFIALCIMLNFSVPHPTNAEVLQKPNQFLDPVTIAGVIGIAKVVSNEVEGIIGSLGTEAQDTIDSLTSLTDELNNSINILESKFQDNTNIAINSLDSASQRAVQDLYQVLNELDEQITKTIDYTAETFRELISETSIEIQTINSDIEQRLSRLIILFVKGSAYLLNLTFYYAILVVSIVFLAVGVLIFWWGLGRLKQRSLLVRIVSWILMLGYLTFFVSLTFLPSFRVGIMEYTGFGFEQELVIYNEPNVFGTIPRKIVLGETEELKMVGENLNPSDDTTLVVTIGSQEVAVKASTETEIVVDVKNLTIEEGTAEINVVFEDGDKTESVISVVEPTPVLSDSDLVVEELQILPVTPVVGELTRFIVTISNRGEKSARNFQVEWQPEVGKTEGNGNLTIDKLDGNETRDIPFDYVYRDAGNAQVFVKIDSSDPESNKKNNTLDRFVTITNPTVEYPEKSFIFQEFSLIDLNNPSKRNYNLNIPTNKFWCGLVGMRVEADINEGASLEIMNAQLVENGNTWEVKSHFQEDFSRFTYVNVMCIDKSISDLYVVKEIDITGGEKKELNFTSDEYTCGVIGFNIRKADIEEKGSGTIIYTQIIDESGKWAVRADFRTEGEEEDWIVRYLCVRNNSNLIFHRSFTSLENDVDHQTSINKSNYNCGIVGMRASSGDINENDLRIIMRLHMQAKDKYWHIRANFATHENDHETWDVDVLCIHKSISINNGVFFSQAGKWIPVP